MTNPSPWRGIVYGVICGIVWSNTHSISLAIGAALALWALTPDRGMR